MTLSPALTRHQREPKAQSVIPDFGRLDTYDPLYLQTPVLFNKYAIERNEPMMGELHFLKRDFGKKLYR